MLLFCSSVFSQANSVRTGVTFTWADTQTNISDPATIESITIDGNVYSTFVVPSNYELTRLGPGGHSGNDIMRNGSEVLGSSNDPSWNSEALDAYQSLNLNHYFESNSNGDNFCENYGAVATTDTQIQTISYNPGIPSNEGGVLAVTERGGNNCFYIEVWGTPVGGGAEQRLGQTFVRNEFNLTGVLPPSPPTANSDYWSSGRNNENGQIIGVALYQLSELAPVGSTITSIRYYAATFDNGDGKFFLMQTYAVDDSFNPEFEEVFNGDVGANDNVPDGSEYTYYASTNPLNGTLVVNTDGTFTYTPDPGFTGTDVFEVQVCLPAPNQHVCDISTVTLDVKSGVSISDATANEGDNLEFTISINDPIANDIEFDISYNDNSTTGADYSGPSTVILPAFANSVTFDVAALDDAWLEGTETFDVTIVDATNTVTIVDGDGVGTIIDTDDATVTTGNYDVDEDTGIVQLRVWLHESGSGVEPAFTVDLTVNSSGITFPATDGSDYNAITTTISFPANSPAGTEFFIPLTILDDAIVEPSEQVIQRLSNASFTEVGLAGAGGMVRIHDNDSATVTLQDITVNEDIGTVDYEFVLSGDVQDSFTIDFTTSDGTAIQPDDYSDTSGSVTFTGNNNEIQTASIAINDDTIIEPIEDFDVSGSYTATPPGFTNAQAQDITVSNSPGTVTITDNDGGPGTGISFDSDSVTVNEGDGTATFTVRLTGNVQGGFTVDYATADGSAGEPGDYTATSGQLTFTGSDNESYDITVPIVDDSLIEPTEDLTVVLSNLSTTLIGINGDTATGNILDNDAVPGTGIAFDNTDVTVNEDAGTATFTVRLTGNVQGGFTVDYTTNDGTAVAPDDYTTQAGTLSFTGTDGENYDIVIPIIDDNRIEATENYVVELLNLSSTIIGINMPQANGNIVDNDNIPGVTGLSFDDDEVTVNEDTGTATFTVRLTGNVQGGFTVDYTTTDDTAINPDDYTLTNGTLTFVGNDDESYDITVPIIDDVIVESTESYFVVLSNLSTTVIGINGDTATGNIIDNDSDDDFPSDVTVDCDEVPTVPTISLNANGCSYTEDFVEAITGQDDGCDTEYTITRTWTITDCVGNVRTHVQTITVEDNEAPTFVEALPSNATVSCDNVPDALTLTALDNCDNNAFVTFDEQITDDDSCASNYIITRTWTAEDCAGNQTVHVQTITVEDTQAPTFVEALPESVTVMCNEIPDAATLTAVDNCDTDVTVTFDEVITNNANCSEGYTVTRTWSVSDCAGNMNSHTQVITINPTGPITASDYEEEITIICGDEVPAVPELTFMGGCGNYDVVFTEDTLFSDDTDDYMITRTWEVTDSCGNTATFEQVIFVMQPQLEEVFIDICVEDDPINLVNYLPEGFDTNGVFTVTSGNVILEGSTFNPANLEVGEYLIAYSSTEGDCKYYVDFIITTNSDCVPCGRDQIEISTAVTANGDNINDVFEIKGVEYCGYTFDVMIFNRWGDKVYEVVNYQNDWGGFAPNNSFGSSGMLPAGTYYYIINVNGADFEPLNGYIYLGTQ
ncbi:Calx-beta domain-containing protein [Allomuricauda sp. d1]|uniref:Calx-beta domain-containing protein n=1 Tax=Allomuricauda sp. d1 TaxID=3136725 RepID=UPI0031CF6D3A